MHNFSRKIKNHNVGFVGLKKKSLLWSYLFNRFLYPSRFRMFGTKCGGCAQGISPNDLVRRAKSKVFHLNCFTCMMCNKQLSTGEELYILDEFKFVCKEDYISSNGKETTLLSGKESRFTLH